MIIDWGQDGQFIGLVTPGVNSKRQDIIDAIELRFKTILTTSGYKTDIGTNVFAWKPGPFEETAVPGMDIRDTADDPGQDTIGEVEHELPIEGECVFSTDASMEDVRKVEADMNGAVRVDLTWGNLADDTSLVSCGRGSVEIAGKVRTSVTFKFTVKYFTERHNSYQ
jgi:hypothetical protein